MICINMAASLIQYVDARCLSNCWYCGCRLYDLRWTNDKEIPEGYEAHQHEHKLPRCRGGRGNRRNIVDACRPCNMKKGVRTVNEFRAKLEWELGTPIKFFGERKRSKGVQYTKLSEGDSRRNHNETTY